METTHKSLTTEVKALTFVLFLITNVLYLLSLHSLELAFNNELIGYLELLVCIASLVVIFILPSWYIIPLTNKYNLLKEKQIKLEIYKSDIIRYILANIILIMLLYMCIVN